MATVHRVLYPEPFTSLDHYLSAGGGVGLEATLDRGGDHVLDELDASGLRGRGGAGFPTGKKWRTVLGYRSADVPMAVVVNAAEGEPGTFKDRTILRLAPYEVLEGALIACRTLGATKLTVALKADFRTELDRVRAALAEIGEAGWLRDIEVDVVEGPHSYLYGEETALLEVLDGRPPFPRIQPPWRRGVDDDADPGGDSQVPPALVDNVETLANVPRIVARGAAWFRTEGTDQSPGTLVCTFTGRVRREAVGEVPMGTPLRQAIDEVAGGPNDDRTVKAVLVGVSNAVLTGDQLDTPLTYEDFLAAGTGLGSGGYLVCDDGDDMVAVAAGVSRFLAVESCGQCQPCKADGIGISDRLERLCRNEATEDDVREIGELVGTVADRNRCNLAPQHQLVVGSILDRFADEVQAHVAGTADPVEPALIAELLDLGGDHADWDERFRGKQPDWSYDDTWDGKWPAEEETDARAPD